jgi:hypothetical protein
MLKVTITTLLTLLIAACGGQSVIYESSGGLEEPYAIMLNEVKVFSETSDTLTVDFIYTYEHEIPAEEIRLFVLPDHGYWQTAYVKISKGKHGARAIIGMSKTNMEKDQVTESETTKLRFRFDHYSPKKYMGSVWGHDVEYQKLWKKDI